MRTDSGERDLREYLEARRAAVDEALGRFLPAETLPPKRLHEAMRYSVFSGGKRLRPVLALATFDLVGGVGGDCLASACATELIHTYSLIHDDLPAMDDDDTRRGRPSSHMRFDEATAILAGDALLTLAFELVACDESLDPGRRAAVLAQLAAANGHAGMVGGQMADIEAEGVEATLATVEFIHAHKTGKPLRAAVLVGALAAGAPEDVLKALSSFGENIGLAFQIADDLLDITSTSEQMGKTVGKDAAQGKATYPVVVGAEAAAAKARELTERALEDLSAFGDAAWPLREIARFIVERKH